MLRFILILLLMPSALIAQIDTRNVLTIGRNALYYNDYVLSIRYFNQVAEAKPYMWEPYYYRALAKYYLEDFAGAETDCTLAAERNPFIAGIYQLRAINRIRLGNYEEAVADYSRSLTYMPNDQSAMYNSALCLLEMKDYDSVLVQMRQIHRFWPKHDMAYVVEAQALLSQTDTARAEMALDTALIINPRLWESWEQKAAIYANREQFDTVASYLTRAIAINSTNPRLYINRALAYYRRNKLRDAMKDYDDAIELSANNYLAHYNRGLLRAQVGDDNRAIKDFDYVLSVNPDNLLARFNRALLLERVGDYRAAITDYTAVIKDYPNFLFGYEARARCYKALGNQRSAAADEKVVQLANINRIFRGARPNTARSVRKWEDNDIEKYNDLATADEPAAQKYSSDYRGQVQNRKTDNDLLGFFEFGFIESDEQAFFSGVYFLKDLDSINNLHIIPSRIVLNERRLLSDTISTNKRFAEIMSLKDSTAAEEDLSRMFVIAVELCAVQELEKADEILDKIIESDTTFALAYFQRAIVRHSIASALNAMNTSSTDAALSKDRRLKSFVRDMENAKTHSKSVVPYADYNIATYLSEAGQYPEAISYYDRVIKASPKNAQAYYNRGLTYLAMNEKDKGAADLSRAGELGIYPAYSLLKQIKK